MCGYNVQPLCWVRQLRRVCQQAPLAFNVNKRLFHSYTALSDANCWQVIPLKKQCETRVIPRNILIGMDWTLRILMKWNVSGPLYCNPCKNVTFKQALTQTSSRFSWRLCGNTRHSVASLCVKSIAMATCNNRQKHISSIMCYCWHNKSDHDRGAQLNESLMSLLLIGWSPCTAKTTTFESAVFSQVKL